LSAESRIGGIAKDYGTHQDFLAIWKAAYPDIPILIVAECPKLQ
jgi:hypothetical protein